MGLGVILGGVPRPQGLVWAAGHSPTCDGSARERVGCAGAWGGLDGKTAPRGRGANCLRAQLPSLVGRGKEEGGYPKAVSAWGPPESLPHSEHISRLRNSHSRFRNFIPKSFVQGSLKAEAAGGGAPRGPVGLGVGGGGRGGPSAQPPWGRKNWFVLEERQGVRWGGGGGRGGVGLFPKTALDLKVSPQ